MTNPSTQPETNSTHLLVDQRFGLAEELRGEDADRGGAVAHHVVLDLGDVDQDLGRRVVEHDRRQDRGAVVGHRDLARSRRACRGDGLSVLGVMS